MKNEKDFIAKNTGLVKKIAKQYVGNGIDFEDLLQEGFLGLVKAKEKFNPAKNAKFSSFAYIYIKKYILKAIDKEINIIKKQNTLDILQNTKQNEDENIKIPKNIPIQEQKIMHLIYNKKLTLTETAKILNISNEKARQLKQKLIRRLKYLSMLNN